MAKPTRRTIVTSAIAALIAMAGIASFAIFFFVKHNLQSAIKASSDKMNVARYLGMPTEQLKHEMEKSPGVWTMTADAVEWELPENAAVSPRVQMVLRSGKVFAVKQAWLTGWMDPVELDWKTLDGKDHPEFPEAVDTSQPVIAGFQDGFETTVYLNTIQAVRKKWQSMHPGVHLIVTYRTAGPPEFMKKSGNEQLDQEALKMVTADFPKPLDHNVPVWGFTVEL